MKSLIAIAILSSCMASTVQGAGRYRGWFRQPTCSNGSCSVNRCVPAAVHYPAGNNHVLPSTVPHPTPVVSPQSVRPIDAGRGRVGYTGQQVARMKARYMAANMIEGHPRTDWNLRIPGYAMEGTGKLPASFPANMEVPTCKPNRGSRLRIAGDAVETDRYGARYRVRIWIR